MKNIEIERKYIIKLSDIDFDYKKYSFEKIIQGYIYLKPVIRVRKSNTKYYLTVKNNPPKNLDSKNGLVCSEYEIEINKKSFNDLIKICKGRMIFKTRYYVPYKSGKKTYTVLLDVFEKELKGLVYAEIEFKTIKEAKKFKPPNWFFKEVTGIEIYKNAQLSICKNVKNILKY